MTRDDILRAVKHYLSLVEGPEPVVEPDRALRRALDALAFAYHFAEAPIDGRSHPDVLRGSSYDALRGRIAARFPDLGLYNDLLDAAAEPGKPEVGVGDAIDDLTDIAWDLHDVRARWETTSEEDALWHLRFGFQTHWGEHLRSLQKYLHARSILSAP